MYRIDSKRGLAAVFVLIFTFAVVVSALSITASPDQGGRVPYQYSIDDLGGHHISSTMIGVIRDHHLPLGESITATGWLATGEGVSSYQYLWVPSGGGYAEWKTVEKVSITSRGDLAASGIPYASGHGSAGFSLTIDPPADTTEGTYDVYIRALDGMGLPCDLVALLNLRYGDPDPDDGKKHGISFARILREGDGSWAGNATVAPEGITLTEDGRVRLGEMNLAAFAQMRITYTATNADAGVGEGRKPVLGLKSTGKHSYGTAGESYNLTDHLVYAALTPGTGEGVIEVDLTEVNHYGDVWLTGYLGGEVTVTGIEFIYHGYVTDRVAAKIYLSADLAGYFGGYNHTTAVGVSDAILGDVLRLEVKDETNDPYMHFNAGTLLADNGIKLDADEYKYMVLLYRAETVNNSNRMNLYLCSGPITGATEACNQSLSLQKDGKWHYLLVDLSQKENWGGIINGWRFDYISAQSDPGDAVEFATVQFFRTAEAATKAASQDPSKQKAFHSGDPAVLRDMSEESEDKKETYVIPDEDTYVVTEAETNPPVSPETSETTQTTELEESESRIDETLPPDETETTPQGCGSVLTPLAALLGVVASIPFVAKKNIKEKHYEA